MKNTVTHPDIKLLEMSELTFDEGPHIYRLNGMVIPSVSQIMEPLSTAEYGMIDRKTLDEAANKGTAVHNAIENWLKFGIEDLNPEYMGYMEGFKEWWELRKPILVGSELRVYHKLLRYAGTVDLLAIIDDELNLIDFKTTYRLVEKNCGVQLEAYSQGFASHGLKIAKKRILHLKKDGTWDDPQFPANDANRWRVFGSLKNVHDYIQS